MDHLLVIKPPLPRMHLNIEIKNVHLVHGTTVATNALLEGKGAKLLLLLTME